MSYQFHAFISYSRYNKATENWVYDHFKPLLVEKLNDLIPEKIEVFLDKTEIKTGNDWNRIIQSGLARSKIFIPLFSPKYFASKYCLLEFWAFKYRQERINHSSGLICPIQISDGKYNPTFTDAIQKTLFSDCYKTYKDISVMSNRENKVIELANIIEERLCNIPEYDTEWDSEQWWDNIIKIMPPPIIPAFSKPEF